MFPSDLSELAPWLGALSILIAYLHNVFTGWKVLPKEHVQLKCGHGIYWMTARYVASLGLTRTKWIKSRPRHERREVAHVLRVHIPYWSIPASAIGCVAHLSWFIQAGWNGQIGLWKFVLNHLSMSILIHCVHVLCVTMAVFIDPDDEWEVMCDACCN